MCKPNTGDENTVESDERWLKTSKQVSHIQYTLYIYINLYIRGTSVLDKQQLYNSQLIPVIEMLFLSLSHDVNSENELLLIP